MKDTYEHRDACQRHGELSVVFHWVLWERGEERAWASRTSLSG